jgi:hypothetical protein
MKTTFIRAAAGLSLTPFERAALRFLEGLGASALLAGLVAIQPYLSGTSVDWANVAHVFLAAAVSTTFLALLKYARAFGDAPLPPLPGA